MSIKSLRAFKGDPSLFAGGTKHAGHAQWEQVIMPSTLGLNFDTGFQGVKFKGPISNKNVVLPQQAKDVLYPDVKLTNNIMPALPLKGPNTYMGINYFKTPEQMTSENRSVPTQTDSGRQAVVQPPLPETTTVPGTNVPLTPVEQMNAVEEVRPKLTEAINKDLNAGGTGTVVNSQGTILGNVDRSHPDRDEAVQKLISSLRPHVIHERRAMSESFINTRPLHTDEFGHTTYATEVNLHAHKRRHSAPTTQQEHVALRVQRTTAIRKHSQSSTKSVHYADDASNHGRQSSSSSMKSVHYADDRRSSSSSMKSVVHFAGDDDNLQHKAKTPSPETSYQPSPASTMKTLNNEIVDVFPRQRHGRAPMQRTDQLDRPYLKAEYLRAQIKKEYAAKKSKTE